MFDRLEMLIGKENVLLLQSKKIVVVGLGGVGGECAISLVRSAISNITLVDFDTVDITNLNRQSCAFMSTIGRLKVDVIHDIIKDINPFCNVIKKNVFLDESNINDIIPLDTDFVIDACDSIESKKSIIKYCLKNKIKFVTCTGTGNRIVPSNISVVDLKKTYNDPLAKGLRLWAKQEKINGKIPTLLCADNPIVKGKVVASSSFVPNSAGLFIGSYVIENFINK